MTYLKRVIHTRIKKKSQSAYTWEFKIIGVVLWTSETQSNIFQPQLRSTNVTYRVRHLEIFLRHLGKLQNKKQSFCIEHKILKW